MWPCGHVAVLISCNVRVYTSLRRRLVHIWNQRTVTELSDAHGDYTATTTVVPLLPGRLVVDPGFAKAQGLLNLGEMTHLAS